jgi:hypothetical protein
LTVVSVLAVAGFAALVAWSLWWPHSDNRQNLATLAAVLLGILGLASFIAALRGASSRGRTELLVFTAMAALTGATAGFMILYLATASAR